MPTTIQQTTIINGACVPCGDDNDFKPDCSYTTRVMQTTIMKGSVISEDESVTIKCNPKAIKLPKLDFKICNCVGQLNGFVLSNLPVSTNGILTISGVPITLSTIINESNNGSVMFERMNDLPFVDEVKFKVSTTCGDSIEYKIIINALCTCVKDDECSDCQKCQ